MTLKDIIHKEDITGNSINLYREGLYWRAYEQSAYRFVVGINSYKPSKRAFKAIDGEIISIRVRAKSLEKFAASFNVLSSDEEQMVIEPNVIIEMLSFERWKENVSLTKMGSKASQGQSMATFYDKEELIKFNTDAQTPDEQLAMNDRWEKMWDTYCQTNKVKSEQLVSYYIVCDLSRAHAYREKGDMEKAHFYLERARVCIEGLHKISHVLYLQELALYKKQRGRYQKALQLTDQQRSKQLPSKKATDSTNAGLADDEILYRNLCELMQSEKIFTAQIGRKELADMLQTNTTYIVEVIKRFSDGMTVTAFINGYRLRYAGKLLAERNDLSVDAIGEEAGFTSRSTYYRQFRDYYGMSPNEYRSISRESNP